VHRFEINLGRCMRQIRQIQRVKKSSILYCVSLVIGAQYFYNKRWHRYNTYKISPLSEIRRQAHSPPVRYGTFYSEVQDPDKVFVEEGARLPYTQPHQLLHQDVVPLVGLVVYVPLLNRVTHKGSIREPKCFLKKIFYADQDSNVSYQMRLCYFKAFKKSIFYLHCRSKKNPHKRNIFQNVHIKLEFHY
jgi:hypothetical protein